MGEELNLQAIPGEIQTKDLAITANPEEKRIIEMTQDMTEDAPTTMKIGETEVGAETAVEAPKFMRKRAQEVIF